MGCAVAIVGSLWRARQSRMVTTYGSSRWATKREVEAAGLFGMAGVLLGRVGGEILVKRRSESETDHGNVAAKRDDQARQVGCLTSSSVHQISRTRSAE
jgi:type IV secretory pathway TraG/TraD family ATPase VirD4